MKANRSIFFIYALIFTLSIFSLFSNYKNFLAFSNQSFIYKAITSGRYEDIPKFYIDRISKGYPNLSATAIPFNTIIGAHWVNSDSLDFGMEYLREGNKDNPYIGFSDMVFANIFQALGVRDSLKFYARQASRKLPNNPAHFALQGRIFLEEKKLDSFVDNFKEIVSRVPDKEVWRLYLSAMVTHKYDLDTIEVNENAKKAKSIFPDNKNLNLTADYVLYGEENVKKSIKLREIAIDRYQIDPEESIQNMMNAIDLIPDNISYYETLIEMLYRNDDYKGVIEQYNILNEIEMTNIRANIIEFISISFVNTNDLPRGCYLANALNNVDYSISPGLRNACRLL